jgi:hypothetical protein
MAGTRTPGGNPQGGGESAHEGEQAVAVADVVEYLRQLRDERAWGHLRVEVQDGRIELVEFGRRRRYG